jgi:polyisoprenoid-binding protein YceI
MRASGRWKLGRAVLLAAGALLSSCHAPAPVPSVPGGPPPAAAAPPAAEAALPHLGTPYDIAPEESLLTVLVFRGGALASAGHNHVIAAHALSGTIYVPPDIAATSFEVHLPVDSLTVDETSLRAAQNSADFPPDVPESARQGTRRNMLGSGLLDAEASPEIVLRALRGAGQSSLPGAAGVLQTRVQIEVRGHPHTVEVPVRYDHGTATVTASGDIALKQSELGLTPFSAMLGALQVQDEMRVRFRIVAHATPAH